MSSTRRARRARRGAVAVVAVGVLASGCGVGADTLRPGTAAEVGPDRIDMGQFNDAALEVCDMLDDLAVDGNAQAVAGSAVRRDVLQSLVLRSVGDQLAEEYGVSAGASYDTALQGTVDQLTELGVADERALAAAEQFTAGTYYSDVLAAIGQQELGLSPAEDSAGESLDEGLRIAAEWQEANGIEVNPRFGTLELDPEQGVERGDSETSVAVSDVAVAAAAGEGSAASLPASQRCG